MVLIVKNQRSFNDDMAAYIERRKASDDSSNNFFKKVDSLITRKKKVSEEVPQFDEINSTVVDRPKKQFWLFALFSKSPTTDLESLDEEDQEIIEEIEEEIEDLDEEVDELETKKMGLFAKLFSFLRGSRSEEDSFEEGEDIDPELVASTIGQHQKNEDLINETRIVLKSLHRWLSKLPPEQIEAFKRSPDFSKYKDLLDKYGLIR